MKIHLYFSLIPESLIASMLAPEQFGRYYAVGTRNRTRGQALFFEIDSNFHSDFFPLHELEKRCRPHGDGSPRKSSYLGIYRVLELLPLNVIGKLYLATTDGRVLALEASEPPQPEEGRLHLYQEFCPVTPRVASKLAPAAFLQHMTNSAQPVSVEKLAFCEMRLEGLATDPQNGEANDLPYGNLEHLRDCLIGLNAEEKKLTKVVLRNLQQEVLYRTIRTGFFVGDNKHMLYYRMPTPEELERDYHSWWQSALTTFNS
jgi:hypothetical protein